MPSKKKVVIQSLKEWQEYNKAYEGTLDKVELVDIEDIKRLLSEYFVMEAEYVDELHFYRKKSIPIKRLRMECVDTEKFLKELRLWGKGKPSPS